MHVNVNCRYNVLRRWSDDCSTLLVDFAAVGCIFNVVEDDELLTISYADVDASGDLTGRPFAPTVTHWLRYLFWQRIFATLHKKFVSEFGYLVAFSNTGGSKLSGVESDAKFRTFW